DHFFLTAAESRFTFDIKNDRNPDPGHALDFNIRIVEIPVHAFCQHAAHGSFSGTHQANQENVFLFAGGLLLFVVLPRHGAILAEAPIIERSAKTKGRRHSAAPLIGESDQRRDTLSLMIFGEMKISSSRRSSTRWLFLNRNPTYGRSPST